MYLDLTKRCFLLLQDIRLGLPDLDEDDNALASDSWLVEGEGSSSPAAAEGRPSHPWYEDRPPRS